MNRTTIVLLISRNNYLQQFLSHIELLECNTDITNIIAVVDGDASLYTDVRNFIEFSKFNQRLHSAHRLFGTH